MKPATPPPFCASAMMCSARVVFPEDSGPKISVTRPRGIPPIPRATSSEMAPVEMTGMSFAGTSAPSRMMAPFP